MKTQKEELLEPFLRYLRIKKISKYIQNNPVLVDLGCGKNYILLDFIKNKIKQGIGLDLNANYLKKGNLIIKKANLNLNLPLKNNFADCVTLLAVLEHLDNPLNILKESRRILRTNGILLLTAPTYASKSVLEFLSYKLKIVNPREIKDHKSYFSKESLNKLIKKAGFKNVFVRYFEFGLNLMAIAYK